MKKLETYIVDKNKRTISLLSAKDKSIVIKFFYDRKGRIKNSESYFLNSLDTKEINSYNSYNDKVKSVIECYNGTNCTYKTNLEYLYSYDSFGNWVTRVQYNDGYPFELIVRHIGY